LKDKAAFAWPPHPVLYEINTKAWLHDLSEKAGRPVTLGSVPPEELERLADFGFDGLWLMGVWARSPRSREIARDHLGLQAEYRRALSDFGAEDVAGSPYAVYAYEPDPSVGTGEELRQFRERLNRMGMGLLLDFVPNHLAVDHPWVHRHPSRFVQASPERAREEPGSHFAARNAFLAHGRDPNFPGWTDTAQLDYRTPETRRAMADLLLSLTGVSDGVRCDMAMLVTRDVFTKTWGGAFDPPLAEFWPASATDVKASRPDFLLVAEAYWDMEWDLQQMGFDFTYDKRLYDRLLHGDAGSVSDHLRAEPAFQNRLVRFVENHDEARAIEAFGPDRGRAAIVLALTLPGLRLVHEGQIEGARVKIPVQLLRRPEEEEDREWSVFHRRLLEAIRDPVFHTGAWSLVEPRASSPGSEAHRNLVAHAWSDEDRFRLTAVNLSGAPGRAFLPLSWEPLGGKSWWLRDRLGGSEYIRDGSALRREGLYVEIPPWGSHLFAFEDAGA